ncbi:MAG: polyprenyl synthetase family protein [Candidatus Thorarchaeota archaeon]|nr:MAG: polyprenyl synthetase family protein [Candidatus Thorarchaeota archaeon]
MPIQSANLKRRSRPPDRSEELLVALQETGKNIDQMIIRYAQVEDTQVQKIIDHALKPRGLRERPFLMRLACQAVGGSFERIIPAAIGIELLHLSTLVLDDILDEAEKRANIATAWRKYGTKNTIIAHEVLRSLATLGILGCCRETNLGPEKLGEVLSIFEDTYCEIYLGQYADMYSESTRSFSENDYYDMVCKTTGSQFRACMRIAAIIAGGNPRQVGALSEYGRLFGIAAQIRDDLMEIIGDEETIGKKVCGDICRNKKRLPLILFLKRNKESRIDAQIQGPDLPDLAKVRKEIAELDAPICIERIASLVSTAVRSISPLDESRSKRLLCTFAEALTAF